MMTKFTKNPIIISIILLTDKYFFALVNCIEYKVIHISFYKIIISNNRLKLLRNLNIGIQ